MNKLTKIALAASLLVGGIASTQACSLGAWDANTSTAIAGGPAEPAGPTKIVRYEGLCSMQTVGGTPAVLNNGIGGATSGPTGEANMTARFYFLPGAATGDIFTTYSDDVANTPVYTVSYAAGSVTVTPAGGGAPAVFAVGITDWHSVEVKWASGDNTNGGAIDVWVDSDAATVVADVSTTSAVASTTIQAAILGGVANMGFDSYESRRTTSIGRILPGDAKAPMDGNIDVVDLQAVIDEILGAGFATGMPNCNEDSTVSTDVQDLQCVVDVILGN